MFRYNPQLGNYCTVKIVDILKTTKTSISIDYDGSMKKFDAFGEEKNSERSIYGSVYYRIFTFDRAKQLFDGKKFNGYRINTGMDFLKTLKS